MSELLQDSVEESVYEREMTDMVYQLACHLLHSTLWWGDVTALLTASVQILLQLCFVQIVEGYHGTAVDHHCQ